MIVGRVIFQRGERFGRSDVSSHYLPLIIFLPFRLRLPAIFRGGQVDFAPSPRRLTAHQTTMGLFDSLAKNALGGMLGGKDPASLLSGLLADAGGLQGLQAKFEASGLGAQFSSWVGSGDNESIDPEQLKGSVGMAEIEKLAANVGMNVSTVLPLLSQFLPLVIDKLTPNGRIADNHPSGGEIQNALMSAITGGLGGFFGGGKR
ncbi:MAG: YidB family protein [Prosthecobacter sp.]